MTGRGGPSKLMLISLVSLSFLGCNSIRERPEPPTQKQIDDYKKHVKPYEPGKGGMLDIGRVNPESLAFLNRSDEENFNLRADLYSRVNIEWIKQGLQAETWPKIKRKDKRPVDYSDFGFDDPLKYLETKVNDFVYPFNIEVSADIFSGEFEFEFSWMDGNGSGKKKIGEVEAERDKMYATVEFPF